MPGTAAARLSTRHVRNAATSTLTASATKSAVVTTSGGRPSMDTTALSDAATNLRKGLACKAAQQDTRRVQAAAVCIFLGRTLVPAYNVSPRGIHAFP